MTVFKSKYLKDKTFTTKEELFNELRLNKDLIIDAKKSEIYKSVDKDQSVEVRSVDLIKFTDQSKAFNVDPNYYYFVVNSTKILDSHEDLHVDGLWNKSVKEIAGKNYFVEDHNLEISKVIARKEHIEIFTAKVPFSVIGKKYPGETEVLVYKIAKAKIKNQDIKEWLDSGDAIECSVRMRYITVELAMDSNAPQDKTYKKTYDTYIDQIANKKDFDYISHFFVIKEAQNVRESSLVVFGSNSSTGVVESKTDQPSNDTDKSKPEPSNDTQKKRALLIN